jgi:general stress protein YciG
MSAAPLKSRKPRYRLTPERAREIGKLGGVARAKALSREQRSEIGCKAATGRWGAITGRSY